MSEIVFVDTHMHVYPGYDAALCLNEAGRNLRANAGSDREKAVYGVCLTERYDCDFFRTLKAGEHALSASMAEDGGSNWVLLNLESGPLYVFAGRQIVCKERVEVLALFSDERIPERELSLSGLCKEVRKNGGLAVVAWAPGKWMFSRESVVAGALRGEEPEDLLLGDTSLRPAGWSTPSLMREGKARGHQILYGSDPLPFAGEETRAGTYAVRVAGTFDPAAPVESLMNGFIGGTVSPVGSRGSLFTVFKRLLKNEKVRRGI